SAEPNSLESKLRGMIRGFAGTVSVYARNLDSGSEVGIEPDRRVRTASTIKLPIACALAAEVEARRARWDERLVIRAQDKVSGSGVLADFSDGETISLRDAQTLMIIVSDNTATNLILDRIGADAVNNFMNSLGLTDTRSMRKIRGDGTQLKPAQGWSREGEKPENKKFGIGASTSREMVRLLELLEQGRVVSPAASKNLLSILERQQYKDGIGRRSGEIRIASKSGSLDALRSDVGIAYTSHGRIAIAITVDDMPEIDYSPDNIGGKLISDLSQVLIAELK
ncbi:MAG: serine hydrolase, partial [Steroidobacteraceae bacterium]